jgi:hypothetical protein
MDSLVRRVRTLGDAVRRLDPSTSPVAVVVPRVGEFGACMAGRGHEATSTWQDRGDNRPESRDREARVGSPATSFLRRTSARTSQLPTPTIADGQIINNGRNRVSYRFSLPLFDALIIKKGG